ncbi:MAG: ABC transporter substrate-binding protein, partial [Acidiferrobacterales bacterium]|nr:ABC transporter substrate-binding protein [Acidiferrobacterales bacterium]
MTRNLSRRKFLTTTAAAAGGAAFMGPWSHTRVYASAADKPIKIGLTHDASGQFANSGQAEKRGTVMAIDEANAAGGVLGRKIEYVWMDTETNPQTGTRVAER